MAHGRRPADSTESNILGDDCPLALHITTPDHHFVVSPPGEGQLVIGRSRNCDLCIDHPSVSRAHAVLHFAPSGATVKDLGSRNGLQLRGDAVPADTEVPIRVGDVVVLGAVTLTLARHGGPTSPRRVWSDGYFGGRVEEECARAARGGGTFAILRVRTSDPQRRGAAEAILGASLRAHDVLASQSRGDLEALLVDATTDQARTAEARVKERLAAHGVTAATALVCYPRDGVGAEALLGRAAAALQGDEAAEPESPFVGSTSAGMQEVWGLAEKVARSMVSVLIQGETGVGKEVCAEAIHRASPRGGQTFLRLHCAALPEPLIESELFGHERGAFTGAAGSKAGLIESAEGGTVFLDEVGELPLSVQVKLLRVLDGREITRIGGLKPHKVDVRFMAATNRSLEADVAAGRFRQDLFFRLAGMTIVIPPLRERRDEILPLARRFVDEACALVARPAPAIDASAAAALEAHPWPGNVRELRNVMERAVVLCGDGPIAAGHLPLGLTRATSPRAVAAAAAAADFEAADVTAKIPRALREEVIALERERIENALTRCGGNQSEAARVLGMSRGALLARLRAYRRSPKPG
jgi:DNA-binding NtrC family response regulator